MVVANGVGVSACAVFIAGTSGASDPHAVLAQRPACGRFRVLASDGTCNRWEGADGRRAFAMTHSHAPDNHNPCDGFAAAAIYEDDLI